MSTSIPVSVIIPVRNEEKHLEICLKSIKWQSYPTKNLELIIVDDGSTDKTLEIAKRYKAKILYNGTQNIERGKSIGLEKAKGKYIFFIDADNFLTSKDSLKIAVEILDSHKNVNGVQWWRFFYDKKDSLANRYCELFGVNDPFVYYLGKRGLLTQAETKWIYKESIIQSNNDYDITAYTVETLPTLGSQGYLTRASSLKETKWKPYLFHLDSVYDLVKNGKQVFALLKRDIGHDYSNSLISVLKKLRRNIFLFWKFKEERRYKYEINPIKLIFIILLMSTFVVPLYDATKGFIKKPDLAWYLHPILCFAVVVLYIETTVEGNIRRFFER